jgi:hypothetical protein
VCSPGRNGPQRCPTRSSAPAGGDPSRDDTYYRHWLNALEWLAAKKGVIDRASLSRYRDAWGHAARQTPHGQPIDLKAEDFRP